MKKAVLVLSVIGLQSVSFGASDSQSRVLSACEDLNGANETKVFELQDLEDNKMDIGALNQQKVLTVISPKTQIKYLSAPAKEVEVAQRAQQCIVLKRSEATSEQVTLKYNFIKAEGCDEWVSSGKPEGWRVVEMPDYINNDHEPHYTAGYNFLNKKVCIKPREVVVEKELILDFSDARELSGDESETFAVMIGQKKETASEMVIQAGFVAPYEMDTNAYFIKHGRPMWTGFRDKLVFESLY